MYWCRRPPFKSVLFPIPGSVPSPLSVSSKPQTFVPVARSHLILSFKESLSVPQPIQDNGCHSKTSGVLASERIFSQPSRCRRFLQCRHELCIRQFNTSWSRSSISLFPCDLHKEMVSLTGLLQLDTSPNRLRRKPDPRTPNDILGTIRLRFLFSAALG